MDDSTQSQTNTTPSTNQNPSLDQNLNFQSDTPRADNADLYPPSSPGSKINAMVGGRLISTAFGLLILIGGLTAGIVLVEQPQLLEQHAQTTGYSACSSVCSPYSSPISTPLINGTSCMSGFNTMYCCTPGYVNVDGTCRNDVPSCTDRQTSCPGSSATGTSPCVAITGGLIYCCGPGSYVYNGACIPTCQTKFCHDYTFSGAVQCTSDSGLHGKYCCPKNGDCARL